ncbi:MAG: hypothetical protein AAB886_00140 [Patescibacteria group bacterium]
MIFYIGIPFILLASVGIGMFSAYWLEDIGVGKMFGVFTFTLGVVILVALFAIQSST